MLVITLGDPLSVSLECLFRLEKLWAKPVSGPVVLVGAWEQWVWQIEELKLEGPPIKKILAWSSVVGNQLFFLDIGDGEFKGSPKELPPEERGVISRMALESLRDLHHPHGEKLAVVTCPIDKHAASLAGFTHPGQTEFFCELWNAPGIMILAGPKLRVGLATNHVKLSEVTRLITSELLEEKLLRFEETLKNVMGISSPKIGVAALNPHAGDQGLFGDEDQFIIGPVVSRMRSRGMDVHGPKPADTLFFQAYEGAYDGVLAMYHDQGLGPLKCLHFYDAVNISGGLPHLRISPDHGPAAELYGKNIAKEDSFRLSLVHARKHLGW